MFCLLFILSSVVEATTKQEVTRLVEVLEMLVPNRKLDHILAVLMCFHRQPAPVLTSVSSEYCKKKGQFILWLRKRRFLLKLMQQSVFSTVKYSNEARGTYSGFSGADLSHKHLQL